MDSNPVIDPDSQHSVEKSRDALRRILKQALETSGAEEGGILVRDELTRQLRVEASEGPGVLERARIIDPDPGKSLCAACAEQGEFIYVDDVPNSPRPFLKKSDTRILTAFVVPVKVGGIWVVGEWRVAGFHHPLSLANPLPRRNRF